MNLIFLLLFTVKFVISLNSRLGHGKFDIRKDRYNKFMSTIKLVVISVFLSLTPFLVVAQTKDALKPIAIPGGAGGIGFDDLRFSAVLGKVLVPAGRTGKLCLIDPKDQSLTVVSGFSAKESYVKGHGDGITSVDEGNGVLFVTDRSALMLDVVDTASMSVKQSASLAFGPDYVRYVAPTNEVWVTQPGKDRIEVFSLSGNKPVHADFIDVSGGPESLIIDKTRGRAYTHLWKSTTLAIDLKSRKIVANWPNGCEGSRGIAFDEPNGFLFVGCEEGKAVVLDVVHDGKPISNITSGSGVDIIAFNPTLAHLYFPGGDSATMAILGVSNTGQLSLLGTVPIAKDSHCVTADSAGNAYVCDPHKGQLLMFHDHFPASR
jgi:DNA-binding beta-propeller fold protein YncE